MSLSLFTRRHLLRLLLFASFLSGCDPTGPQLPEATFHATWAGTPWRGEASATFHPHSDTLYLFGVNPVGAGSMPHTYVRIRVVFEGAGTYTLGAGDAEFLYLLGGDVVVATYGTTDVQRGTLVIEESTVTRIRGQLAFEAESLREYSPQGPQARFEGTFDARIFKIP